MQPFSSSPAEQILVNYFRAKDGNRPRLLDRVFSADAQLEVRNASSSIAFPGVTLGREQIADVLVREFGRTYENVYSFYLSAPPRGTVEQFSCSWLVGMTEKSDKTVNPGSVPQRSSLPSRSCKSLHRHIRIEF